MLVRRIALRTPSTCRPFTSSAGPKTVERLADATTATFRRAAFEPSAPALLPRDTFSGLPAIEKWFMRSKRKGAALELNIPYLSQYGATVVPIEIINGDKFVQVEQSLSFFLECVKASNSTFFSKRPNRYFTAYVPGARPMQHKKHSNDFFTSTSTVRRPTARVYLAQASLAHLPQRLKDDVPTPELVMKAGKGDIYDTSIWLGQAPTYTPLHRDPNPNLFVQLAGTKLVRLYKPSVGQAIFSHVQEQLGTTVPATMRGEEMMHGKEKKLLEEAVWEKDAWQGNIVWHAELKSGDGLFIPKGWWHSVKGVGHGMTGSVNWWFR